MYVYLKQNDCRADTTAKGLLIWANISTSTTSLLQGQSFKVEILAQINKPFSVVSALQSVWFIYTQSDVCTCISTTRDPATERISVAPASKSFVCVFILHTSIVNHGSIPRDQRWQFIFYFIVFLISYLFFAFPVEFYYPLLVFSFFNFLFLICGKLIFCRYSLFVTALPCFATPSPSPNIICCKSPAVFELGQFTERFPGEFFKDPWSSI